MTNSNSIHKMSSKVGENVSSEADNQQGSTTLVKCMLCGKKMHFVSPTHLRFCRSNTARMDTFGYRLMFPTSPLSSAERSRKIGKAVVGRKYLQLWCERVSVGKMGKKRADGGVMLGKHHSSATKQRLSAVFSGRRHSPETRERITTAMQRYRGNANPAKRPEVREKISRSKRQAIAEGRLRNFPWSGPTHTNYNFRVGFREDLGHYVRSSWEANIARLLRWFGCLYEYEKMRFPLHLDGVLVCSYLPDFFLPGKVVWEVRGFTLDESYDKLSLFRQEYPDWSLCLVDSTQYKLLERKFSCYIPGWE